MVDEHDGGLAEYPVGQAGGRLGSLRGVCEIPVDLLNNSVYNLRLMLVKDTTIVLYTFGQALTFEAADKFENSHYFGEWPGCVRFSRRFPVVALPAAPSQARA